MEDGNGVNRAAEGFIVGGYTYETKEGAAKAKEEIEAIKYLSSKADYKDIKQVYKLYNAILDKQLFKTQVGMDYLKKLQQHLYKSKDIPDDMIRPIPVNIGQEDDSDDKRSILLQKGTINALKRSVAKYKGYYTKLLFTNIALVIIIIIMLIMAATNSNPTVLNYETKLQDKYSSWEEDLKSREAAVKKREAELGIR